jgi:sugar/nucleoside kinase (ribokinase family)
MCLGTAQALRQGFQGPLYADLHSLFLGMQHDGVRTLRPLPDAPSWFGCFDAIQLNEDEMRQLSSDPLALAADALGAGTRLLVVTLGQRGAAYVADPGFNGWPTLAPTSPAGFPAAPAAQSPFRHSAIRTALIPAPASDALDPTGCGDVFGAALFARLLSGDAVEPALVAATRMAARNAGFRGASGLSQHLRGELVTP